MAGGSGTRPSARARQHPGSLRRAGRINANRPGTRLTATAPPLPRGWLAPRRASCPGSAFLAPLGLLTAKLPLFPARRRRRDPAAARLPLRSSVSVTSPDHVLTPRGSLKGSSEASRRLRPAGRACSNVEPCRGRPGRNRIEPWTTTRGLSSLAGHFSRTKCKEKPSVSTEA